MEGIIAQESASMRTSTSTSTTIIIASKDRYLRRHKLFRFARLGSRRPSHLVSARPSRVACVSVPRAQPGSPIHLIIRTFSNRRACCSFLSQHRRYQASKQASKHPPTDLSANLAIPPPPPPPPPPPLNILHLVPITRKGERYNRQRRGKRNISSIPRLQPNGMGRETCCSFSVSLHRSCLLPGTHADGRRSRGSLLRGCGGYRRTLGSPHLLLVWSETRRSMCKLGLLSSSPRVGSWLLPCTTPEARH
ncbi:uncharacterized protein IWZ02DRAFT_29181 [Phyllosticta citriasiana]|uniref:uncharacterized protein n=1 Tax=Phyllosticta citriasiana TaxID=595635 RepID=UPI0030FD86A2